MVVIRNASRLPGGSRPPPPPHPRDAGSGNCKGGSSSSSSSEGCEDDEEDDASIISSSEAVALDPSRDDIPEDAYIACGGHGSQILGRTMNAEYGTSVPSSSVYVSSRRPRKREADETLLLDEDGGESTGSGDAPGTRRSSRKKLSTARDVPQAKHVVRRADSHAPRKAPDRRKQARDPSLRDLSGLWGGGGADSMEEEEEDEEEEEEEEEGGMLVEEEEGEEEEGCPNFSEPPGEDPDDGDAPGGGGGGGVEDAINARSRERCWICTFSAHPLARQVSSYICSNVSTVDTMHMATQIKDEILEKFPNARGARKRDIVRHITEHMLSPNVKMASVLRSLVTVAETLRGTMHQRDPETGDVVVDLKSTEVYLKVLNQITSTYKMDGNKLMFSKD